MDNDLNLLNLLDLRLGDSGALVLLVYRGDW